MFVIKKIENSKIKRVCITHTVYTLLQYLLISSEKEIEETFFFFTDDKFTSFFPNSTVLNLKRGRIIRSKYLRAYWLLWRRHKLWPFLKNAEIYAQDHLLVDFMLLHGNRYIMLEDGFGSYTYRPFKFKFRLWKKLPFYPNGIFTWGNASNCICRLLSHEPDENSFLRKKNWKLMDFKKLWEESSERKRKFILNLFNLTKEDLDLFGQFDNLILTQNFSEVQMISEEAKIKCYRNIIEHFQIRLERTLFKPHPKEKTDYTQHFPGVHVYTKAIPIELIALQLKTDMQIYTVSSSGVFVFPEKQVTWCDTAFSPELKEKYGSLPKPF